MKKIFILLFLTSILALTGCSSNADTAGGTSDHSSHSNNPTIDSGLIGTWGTDIDEESNQNIIDFTFSENNTFQMYEMFLEDNTETTTNQNGEILSALGSYIVEDNIVKLTFEEAQDNGYNLEGQIIKNDLTNQTLEFEYKLDGDSLSLSNADIGDLSLVRTTPE